MAKNIVVCCDGTSNQLCHSNTNVLKLYQSLVHEPGRQATYYHPGLGTMETAGALTSVGRRLTKLAGLAIGYGLEEDVLRAYRFIAASHEPGDRIYLFGFSRGAYTARAVASLLHAIGILRVGNEDLARYAWRLMSAWAKDRARTRPLAMGPDLVAEFRNTFSGAPCRIRFVGVWDTVSSVGWVSNPLRLAYTADNPSIDIGRHAVSIDERRAFFRTNLWRPHRNGGPKDMRQVWFPGDHCDVGGGHPPGETAQSDMALAWMLREATLAGLLVSTVESTDSGRDVPPHPLHESLKGWWRVAEFLPKHPGGVQAGRLGWRMNLFRRRGMPDDAIVHESAFRRGRPYVDRLPGGARREDRHTMGSLDVRSPHRRQ